MEKERKSAKEPEHSGSFALSPEAQAWIRENWAAIQSSNAWVDEHGLPLAKFRLF
ncbi:type II toxin-antitoxin system CcdA family antitoxin [Sphingomonas tabacisoli]|uniref:Type II toxin-antitoxin system CcdA family antitoxin n=1 Tax=Sphingomonas tabacisoli TaxID=2249466 RepID=A0ABW4I632_9SPHN